MDIIYQLPVPDEICSKILLYASRSPHTHLQEEIFKRTVPTDIYQKLVERRGIKTDAHGHITNVSVENFSLGADLESVQFDIRVLPRNLTEINFASTGVTGDIEVLQELPNLTAFFLHQTGVTGNKEAFHNYRDTHELEECKVYM